MTWPLCHLRAVMDVGVSLKEKSGGLRTPLDASAPTAVSVVTGSKKAS